MAGTGKKLWDNRDSGLRYEEHLNGSPLVIQHTISIFTLRVKVKRRWTYLFYKKAADAAGCLSQSSPLSLHSRAWQTLKNVARKKKKKALLCSLCNTYRACEHAPLVRDRFDDICDDACHARILRTSRCSSERRYWGLNSWSGASSQQPTTALQCFLQVQQSPVFFCITFTHNSTHTKKKK